MKTYNNNFRDLAFNKEDVVELLARQNVNVLTLDKNALLLLIKAFMYELEYKSEAIVYIKDIVQHYFDNNSDDFLLEL